MSDENACSSEKPGNCCILRIFHVTGTLTTAHRSLLTAHDDTKFRAIWKLHAIYGMQQKLIFIVMWLSTPLNNQVSCYNSSKLDRISTYRLQTCKESTRGRRGNKPTTHKKINISRPTNVVIYLLIYLTVSKVYPDTRTKKRALWKPGMPEYHGIWRNITEYHDIFQEYIGTSRYFPMVAMRLFINMDVWRHIYYESDGSFPFWR